MLLNEAGEIVCCLKESNTDITEVVSFNDRKIDGISLVYEVVERINNLPECKENVFYIVDDSVANSVIVYGKRNVEDLYLVYDKDWNEELDCYLATGLYNAALV